MGKKNRCIPWNGYITIGTLAFVDVSFEYLGRGIGKSMDGTCGEDYQNEAEDREFHVAL